VCSPSLLRRYRERLSGPLLDRIDLRITVPRVSPEDLVRAPRGPSSDAIRGRVAEARAIGLERQGTVNSRLTGQALRRHCALDVRAEALVRQVIARHHVSGRGYDRLLRVARTIADLSASPRICEEHVAEAVAYRGGEP
jgi:magnesium chelatase family protein